MIKKKKKKKMYYLSRQLFPLKGRDSIKKEEEEKFKRQGFQKVFSQARQLLKAAVEQEKVLKTELHGGTAGTKQSRAAV